MKMRFLGLLGASLLAVLGTACGDDGNNNNGTCGDGHTTGSETCDDGNTTGGDGCSATCKTESGHCGDGTVDVATETCDDGNTASGDGCSATCQTEAPVGCGNGVIAAPETCDDGNTTASDGCSATCTTETGYTCTGTPSVCTMGGGSLGTCAAPFNVTFTGTTDLTATLTGDTTGSTNQVVEAECDGFGPEGGGKDHVYKFTTTTVRDVVVEIDAASMNGPIVRLMRAPCDVTTEIPEYTGAADGCADLDGSGFLGYVNLAAGTYYLIVDGYDDTQEGTYTVTLNAKAPTCGNGMVDPQLEFCDDGNVGTGDGCNANCEVETGFTCKTLVAGGITVCEPTGCGDGVIQAPEVCDDDNMADGDGCSATCTVETGYTCNTANPTVCVLMGCGNGIIEMGEECDDGNMADGDRCSSTCILESDVTEAAEPNDTTPQVLSAGNHIIRGTFATDDVDLYSFTLATPQTVQIETYATINAVTTDYGGVGTNKIFDCLTALDDPELALFAAGVDTTMSSLALAVDGDDGDGLCSYLGPNDSADDGNETGADPTQLMNLPAGTYTIRLTSDPLADPIAGPQRYLIDLTIGASVTTPVAPAAGDIKINEFLAADGGASNGGIDSNCDTILTNTDDEFIELVNVSNKVLDLTGLTIKDGGTPTATPPIPPQLQFTFAPASTGSMTLAPGKAVVVWAGGAPNCPGVTNWFTAPAAQHTLSLNDAGDTITLATGGATPVTIATVTYAAQTVGTSSNLSPDVTGTAYALHSAVTGAVGNISPGKHADGTAF
ncbi:hypothetical protein BH11MYX3_BH11MYX3_01880 [soil metagenome]